MKKNFQVIPKWTSTCQFIPKRSRTSVTFVEQNSLSPVAFISTKRSCVAGLWCSQIPFYNEWINTLRFSFLRLFSGWVHGFGREYRKGGHNLSILQQNVWQPLISKTALTNSYRGENIFLSWVWGRLHKIKQFVQTSEKRGLQHKQTEQNFVC